MKSTAREDIADPKLYRTYWSLMLSDALHKQGLDATKENKEALHELHKKILGYETISGRSQEVVSRFLFEVAAYYSVEKGIFIRTSKKQPYNLDQMPLADVWDVL